MAASDNLMKSANRRAVFQQRHGQGLCRSVDHQQAQKRLPQAAALCGFA
jgi:hypothetical protein